MTASVTATSEEVRALLHKNRPALEKLLADSDALMARLNKTADGLEDLVKDADGLVKDADRVVVENHQPKFVDEWDLIQKVQRLGEDLVSRMGISYPSRWPVV